MSLYESVRRQIVPIHPEGYVFISAFAVGSLVLHWIWPPLGWVGAALVLAGLALQGVVSARRGGAVAAEEALGGGLPT